MQQSSGGFCRIKASKPPRPCCDILTIIGNLVGSSWVCVCLFASARACVSPSLVSTGGRAPCVRAQSVAVRLCILKGDTQMLSCLSVCVSGDLALLSGSRGVNRKGWSSPHHFLCLATRLRSPVCQQHTLTEHVDQATNAVARQYWYFRLPMSTTDIQGAKRPVVDSQWYCTAVLCHNYIKHLHLSSVAPSSCPTGRAAWSRSARSPVPWSRPSWPRVPAASSWVTLKPNWRPACRPRRDISSSSATLFSSPRPSEFHLPPRLPVHLCGGVKGRL